MEGDGKGLKEHENAGWDSMAQRHEESMIAILSLCRGSVILVYLMYVARAQVSERITESKTVMQAVRKES